MIARVLRLFCERKRAAALRRQAFCRRQNLELDGLGLPSLTGMDKLTLRGRFHFQDGAVLRGTLLMENDSDETKEILPGVYAGA